MSVVGGAFSGSVSQIKGKHQHTKFTMITKSLKLNFASCPGCQKLSQAFRSRLKLCSLQDLHRKVCVL